MHVPTIFLWPVAIDERLHPRAIPYSAKMLHSGTWYANEAPGTPHSLVKTAVSSTAKLLSSLTA